MRAVKVKVEVDLTLRMKVQGGKAAASAHDRESRRHDVQGRWGGGRSFLNLVVKPKNHQNWENRENRQKNPDGPHRPKMEWDVVERVDLEEKTAYIAYFSHVSPRLNHGFTSLLHCRMLEAHVEMTTGRRLTFTLSLVKLLIRIVLCITADFKMLMLSTERA